MKDAKHYRIHKKIHKHPKSYFLYTLEIMIDDQIDYIHSEFKNENLWGLNSALFLEIQTTQKKMQKKPSWINKFFSLFIPLEKKSRIHQKKLTILFDELNVRSRGFSTRKVWLNFSC